jgi:hypothetical protein
MGRYCNALLHYTDRHRLPEDVEKALVERFQSSNHMGCSKRPQPWMESQGCNCGVSWNRSSRPPLPPERRIYGPCLRRGYNQRSTAPGDRTPLQRRADREDEAGRTYEPLAQTLPQVPFPGDCRWIQGLIIIPGERSLHSSLVPGAHITSNSQTRANFWGLRCLRLQKPTERLQRCVRHVMLDTFGISFSSLVRHAQCEKYVHHEPMARSHPSS